MTFGFLDTKESEMPHHTSQERWPRAVPLMLLEEVVRPASIEILDPPEARAQKIGKKDLQFCGLDELI